MKRVARHVEGERCEQQTLSGLHAHAERRLEDQRVVFFLFGPRFDKAVDKSVRCLVCGLVPMESLRYEAFVCNTRRVPRSIKNKWRTVLSFTANLWMMAVVGAGDAAKS